MSTKPIEPDVPIVLNEKKRVYVFPEVNVTLKDTTELVVRPSGTHRVKTADGGLHIIATGWYAVHITDAKKEWTA